MPQRDDPRHIFGARPKAAFVPCAVEDWLQLDASTNVQCADAHRSVELVTGHRDQINAQFVSKCSNLAHALRRVGVHKDVVRVAHVGDFANRLNCTGFVVGVHDADQARVFANRCFDT